MVLTNNRDLMDSSAMHYVFQIDWTSFSTPLCNGKPLRWAGWRAPSWSEDSRTIEKGTPALPEPKRGTVFITRQLKRREDSSRRLLCKGPRTAMFPALVLVAFSQQMGLHDSACPLCRKTKGASIVMRERLQPMGLARKVPSSLRWQPWKIKVTKFIWKVFLDVICNSY